MSRRSRLLAAAAAVAMLLAVAWTVSVIRDGDLVRVSARVESFTAADQACGSLPGIEDGTFSTTSHVAPGSLSDTVTWSVRGSGHPAAVVECLLDLGAADVTVDDEPAPPQQSFERTDG